HSPRRPRRGGRPRPPARPRCEPPDASVLSLTAEAAIRCFSAVARAHGGARRSRRAGLTVPVGCDNPALMSQRFLRTALLLTIGVAPGLTAQDSDVFILRERTPAPAFALPDLSGKTVDAKTLAGKIGVRRCGAAWC